MNEKGTQVAIGSKKRVKPALAHKLNLKPPKKTRRPNVEWQKAVMREMKENLTENGDTMT